MACSCRKHKKSDLTPTRTVKIPHTVLPGESCMFCAEKHVAVAYSTYLTERLRPVTRQIMIGELECARRHTILEYKSECSTIAAAIKAFLLRDQEAPDILKDAQLAINRTVSRIEGGEDTTGAQLFMPQTGLDRAYHPLIGELFFSSAYRLAMECGYAEVNRTMIIGDLSLAQLHFFKFNYNLAERLRDIRHRIQRSEFTSVASDWIILAQNIDVSITPNIEEIKKTHGSDLSWYLGA